VALSANEAILGGYLSMRPAHHIHHFPHLPRATMSGNSSPSTSRSNLDSIFNAALQAYKKKTGKDITTHPLATELQSCHSPDTILAVLRRQTPSLDQFRSREERFTKCLTPIINVLYAFSATFGDGVGLVIVTTSSCREFEL
jgi:hypothetical protein